MPMCASSVVSYSYHEVQFHVQARICSGGTLRSGGQQRLVCTNGAGVDSPSTHEFGDAPQGEVEGAVDVVRDQCEVLELLVGEQPGTSEVTHVNGIGLQQ